jgi:hypothetical protein
MPDRPFAEDPFSAKSTWSLKAAGKDSNLQGPLRGHAQK